MFDGPVFQPAFSADACALPTDCLFPYFFNQETNP